MRAIDIGAYFVVYDFIIGVLLVLASDKAAAYIGVMGMSARKKVERYARITIQTFGASVAVLCGSIYLFLYVLRWGVD